MLKLDNDNEKKLVSSFIRLLLRCKAYKRYLAAIHCRQDNLLNTLRYNAKDLINTPISWSGTPEGWGYWASISNAWKDILEKKYNYCFTPTDRWERDGDERLLSLTEIRYFDRR